MHVAPQRHHYTCNPSGCPATYAASPTAPAALQSFCPLPLLWPCLLMHMGGEDGCWVGGKKEGGQPALLSQQRPATAELRTCPSCARDLLPLGSRESGGTFRWDLTCAASWARGGGRLLPPVSVQASRGPCYVVAGHCRLGRDRPDMQGTGQGEQRVSAAQGALAIPAPPLPPITAPWGPLPCHPTLPRA